MGPIAPLPMAVGTVAMMVIAVVGMFAADVVPALIGLLVFRPWSSPTRLPAVRPAADDRASSSAPS